MNPYAYIRKMDECRKAEKLFDVLTSYGDSAEDRRAALELVLQSFPNLTREDLFLPGFGI